MAFGWRPAVPSLCAEVHGNVPWCMAGDEPRACLQCCAAVWVALPGCGSAGLRRARAALRRRRRLGVEPGPVRDVVAGCA